MPRDVVCLPCVLDVGCWTPARDLSEFGVLVYRAADRAPLFAVRCLLPLHGAHSSSPRQVLSPMQVAASGREDRQSRWWEMSSGSSTRMANGSNRQESRYGRRATLTAGVFRANSPAAILNWLDQLRNAFSEHEAS